MMGRNHVITGFLAIGWVGSTSVATGVSLAQNPTDLALAASLFLWGTTAPDLDAEQSVAVSTWAPHGFKAGAHQEKLLPSAKTMLATITPGSHWLSAGMRLIARRHYLLTRDTGDPESDDDPHRKLWHTFLGALVMAAVVCLLLSPVPLIIASQWWPWVNEARTATGRWWLPWLTAAPWAGFMTGVWVRAYFGEKIKVPFFGYRSSRAFGFGLGALLALGCGAAADSLGSSWVTWTLAIVLGCGVHVAGDKCSRHGASWWAPLVRQPGNRRWAPSGFLPRWARFRTGFFGESLFVLALIGFSLVCWWVILSAGAVLPMAWNLWTVLE